MRHSVSLISTFATGLGLAPIFDFLAVRMIAVPCRAVPCRAVWAG